VEKGFVACEQDRFLISGRDELDNKKAPCQRGEIICQHPEGDIFAQYEVVQQGQCGDKVALRPGGEGGPFHVIES